MNDPMWGVYCDEELGTRHVMPMDRGHVVGLHCWCNPRRDTEDPDVIIHDDKAITLCKTN
jgi:hypothetical protein